jgi:hypothetical protein
MILALHYRTEEYGCVVYEIRGMLGEIKYQEVEVQSYHTANGVDWIVCILVSDI